MNLRKAAPELGHVPTPDATQSEVSPLEAVYRNRAIAMTIVAVGLVGLVGWNEALRPAEPKAPAPPADRISSSTPAQQSPSEEPGGPLEWIIGPIDDLLG